MSKLCGPPLYTGCRIGVAAPSGCWLLVMGECYESVIMAYARDATIEVVQCSVSIMTLRDRMGMIKSFDESLPAGNNDVKSQ